MADQAQAKDQNLNIVNDDKIKLTQLLSPKDKFITLIDDENCENKIDLDSNNFHKINIPYILIDNNLYEAYGYDNDTLKTNVYELIKKDCVYKLTAAGNDNNFKKIDNDDDINYNKSVAHFMKYSVEIENMNVDDGDKIKDNLNESIEALVSAHKAIYDYKDAKDAKDADDAKAAADAAADAAFGAAFGAVNVASGAFNAANADKQVGAQLAALKTAAKAAENAENADKVAFAKTTIKELPPIITNIINLYNKNRRQQPQQQDRSQGQEGEERQRQQRRQEEEEKEGGGTHSTKSAPKHKPPKYFNRVKSQCDRLIFFVFYYPQFNDVYKKSNKSEEIKINYIKYLEDMKSLLKNKKEHINKIIQKYEHHDDFNNKYKNYIEINSIKRIVTKIKNMKISDVNDKIKKVRN